MSVMRRTFTREFKLSVCEKVKQGQQTKAAACREHSLSPSLLDRWMDQYEAKGRSAFQDGAPVDLERRVKELEASLGRAHLENEFLREALGKLGIPARRQP
jgi:transposase-like protein